MKIIVRENDIYHHCNNEKNTMDVIDIDPNLLTKILQITNTYALFFSDFLFTSYELFDKFNHSINVTDIFVVASNTSNISDITSNTSNISDITSNTSNISDIASNVNKSKNNINGIFGYAVLKIFDDLSNSTSKCVYVNELITLCNNVPHINKIFPNLTKLTLFVNNNLCDLTNVSSNINEIILQINKDNQNKMNIIYGNNIFKKIKIIILNSSTINENNIIKLQSRSFSYITNKMYIDYDTNNIYVYDQIYDIIYNEKSFFSYIGKTIIINENKIVNIINKYNKLVIKILKINNIADVTNNIINASNINNNMANDDYNFEINKILTIYSAKDNINNSNNSNNINHRNNINYNNNTNYDNNINNVINKRSMQIKIHIENINNKIYKINEKKKLSFVIVVDNYPHNFEIDFIVNTINLNNKLLFILSELVINYKLKY